MKKILAVVAVAAIVAFAAPAFAANPFMDVPMNHWAYDAVGQLAARGIVTGYPDGSYKGNQPITRYEMASVIARSLAVIDMDKASKQDVEMLKKLVVEFKDELDALGVKVDALDSRVAVLEENLGGWKFGGEFRFDANFADQKGSSVYGLTKDSESDKDFNLSRYRLHVWKQISDKVKFYARINGDDDKDSVGGVYSSKKLDTTLKFNKYYITVDMPWDVTANIGRYCVNWEDIAIDGEGEAVMMDQTRLGYYMDKPFSMGTFSAFVSREDDDDASTDFYVYGARVAADFNEKFGMAVNYLKYDFDAATGDDFSTWIAQGHVNFTDDIVFKGAYYKQDLADDPTGWRAMVDVDQDAFGFSSLWVEYASYEEGFVSVEGDTYDLRAGGNMDFSELDATKGDLDVLDIYAAQKWNDKWTTSVRYATMDYAVDSADATNWMGAVKYYYTPELSFELAYDKYDADNDDDDDNLIRFRTYVSF